MKHIESFLSFIVAVVGMLFPRRWKKLPPCCPCPYPEESFSQCPYDDRWVDEK